MTQPFCSSGTAWPNVRYELWDIDALIHPAQWSAGEGANESSPVIVPISLADGTPAVSPGSFYYG